MTKAPRTVGWSIMLVLAIGVAGYAVGAIVSESLRTAFVQNLFENLALATTAHLGGGSIALVAGALQLNAGLRRRAIRWHRWIGRLYVVAVATSGVAGLSMAAQSTGGLVAHLGFGSLAILWLTSTAIAFVHIRAGDVAAHRVWMIRSYALTLAAVTLRIYLPISQIAGIDFVAAYQAIAWLCWVPNLLVVEWLLLRRSIVVRSDG